MTYHAVMSYTQFGSSSRPHGETISVTSLNRMARSLLENHFGNVVVEGEISNLSMPSSGHWYFTLKDEGSQIRCAMFRNRNMSARFRPRDGMQVIVRGKLSIYEGRGDYQLIAEGVEEAGDGALRRRFEMLKQSLADEGLFRDDLKKPLPEHTRHIGVITSPTGAVIRDIVSVLRRRFPAIRVTLFPVQVQGTDAPAAIVKAIATANRRAAEFGLDVLIVGRGGGSLEDLQAFNEEGVARAIHASQLPIVSAVGHETDFTIADFVADLRAPTPSAAAEVLSPDQAEFLQTFAGFEQVFGKQIKARLQLANQQLVWQIKQLKHPGRRLQEHAQTLDILEGRLVRATRHHISHTGHALQGLHQRLLLQSPRNTIQRYALRQDALVRRLQQALKQGLKERHTRIGQLAHSLDSISPLSTLQRGYSITFDDSGQVLRDYTAVKKDSFITSRLGSGTVRSKVVELVAPVDALQSTS